MKVYINLYIYIFINYIIQIHVVQESYSVKLYITLNISESFSCNTAQLERQ